MPNQSNDLYEFGEFVLDWNKRHLWHDGELIKLPAKAFDTLLMLVENRGETLSKEEMLDHIWEGAFVEENNLSQKISILRRTFGKENDFIKTIPKKGFQFVEPVSIKPFEHQFPKSTDDVTSRAKTGSAEETVADNEHVSALPAQNSNEKVSTKNSTAGKIMIGGIAVLLIAMTAFGYWIYKGVDEIDSVAVMPFVNESEDPSLDYISDGMAESLIRQLSKIPGLSTKSKNAVFRFKGKQVAPNVVGDELGVRAVLYGRVHKTGDDIAVKLELVDTQTANVLWAQEYNRNMNGLLALQSEIAREVTAGMQINLTNTELERVTKIYTSDSDANLSYLKGRYFWNKRNVSAFEKAINYFNEAIERDPNFALAYSGLADTYSLMAPYGGLKPKEHMPLAKQAALKALEIDDRLAETHASLGNIFWSYEFNSIEAERSFRRAIELDPSYPAAHQWLGELLSTKGFHKEGRIELDRALKLDPLSVVANAQLGKILLLARKYDEAANQLKKAIELDSDYPLSYWYLADCFEAKANYSDAVEQLSEFHRRLGVTRDITNEFRDSFKSGGWENYNRKILAYQLKVRANDMSPNSPVFSNYAIALTYANLRERDDALKYLNQAINEREPASLLIKTHHIFDGYRNNKQFIEMLEKIDLAGN